MKIPSSRQIVTDKLAREIAIQLGEQDDKPRRQIEAIIKYGGESLARRLLDEAQGIQEAGGLMLPDQSRKRTLGGVFFHLARAQFPKSAHKLIFGSYIEATDGVQKYPLKWDERMKLIQALLPEQGVVSTVKVTLIGRPGRLEIRGGLVITTMSHLTRFPNLPREMPVPPSTPTLYTVYMKLKQWRRVEALMNNPDDLLIVEGVCAFDPQLKAIAVFAVSLTTRATEINRREAQRQSNGKAITETRVETDPARVQKDGINESAQPAYTLDRLSELYTTASLLRQKIRSLQEKPASQRAGLEMAQKLLSNVESQIAELEKKAADGDSSG